MYVFIGRSVGQDGMGRDGLGREVHVWGNVGDDASGGLFCRNMYNASRPLFLAAACRGFHRTTITSTYI